MHSYATPSLLTQLPSCCGLLLLGHVLPLWWLLWLLVLWRVLMLMVEPPLVPLPLRWQLVVACIRPALCLLLTIGALFPVVIHRNGCPP